MKTNTFQLSLFILIFTLFFNIHLSGQVPLGHNISSTSSMSLLGKAIAIYDNKVIIGSPSYSSNYGLAQIYEWDGSNWNQLGQDILSATYGDQLGHAVSINQNRVAISAPYNDDNGTDAGQTKVYEWNGTTWNQLGQSINGEAAGDQFGTSTSLHNNKIAIGAPKHDGNGTDVGHVRVYNWDGTAWT